MPAKISKQPTIVINGGNPTIIVNGGKPANGDIAARNAAQKAANTVAQTSDAAAAAGKPLSRLKKWLYGSSAVTSLLGGLLIPLSSMRIDTALLALRGLPLSEVGVAVMAASALAAGAVKVFGKNI